MKNKKRNIFILNLVLLASLTFTGCSANQTVVKTPTPTNIVVAKPKPTNTISKQDYLVKVNKIINDTASSRANIIKYENDFQRVIDVPELISSEIDKTTRNLETLKTMEVYGEYKEAHGYLINALGYYIEWWNADLGFANQKNMHPNSNLMKKTIIANDKATINIRKVFDMIPQVNK